MFYFSKINFVFSSNSVFHFIECFRFNNSITYKYCIYIQVYKKDAKSIEFRKFYNVIILQF